MSLPAYRRFWEESFDRLEDYLRELKARDEKAAMKETRHGRKPRRP